MIKKRNTFSDISQISCANTGMSVQDLLDDRKIYKILNIDKIRDVLTQKLKDGKEIYIFGDYDVDGICSAAICTLGFRAFGYGDRVHIRLPKRISEGYGIQEKSVNEFKDGQVLITVDNGITAIDAIKRAKEKGMYVIVVDHHLPAEKDGAVVFPDADIIIDPKAIPNSADFDGYCGAGLCYRIMNKLVQERTTVFKMLTLAAVATIADVVPLIGENRRIVKYGLKYMTILKYTTTGLFSLLMECKCNEFVSEGNIAYKIAPCINAPGRLLDDGAMESYRLLSFDGSIDEAQKMAEKQLDYNKTRKQLSDEWTEKAKAEADAMQCAEKKPAVIALEGIPEGICGIAAGRIAEYAKVPCIILGQSSINPGVLHGSARTYGDIDIYSLIKTGSEYLLTFGGHKPAAGLSLEKDKVEDFRNAVNAAFAEVIQAQPAKDSDCEEIIYYDLEVCGSKSDEIIAISDEIEEFGPYGLGNPAPVLYLKDLPLISYGSKYYKYLEGNVAVKLQSGDIECISFDHITDFEKMGSPGLVNLIGTMSKYLIRGEKKTQFEFSYVEQSEKYVKKVSRLAQLIAKKAAERQRTCTEEEKING